MISRVTPEGMQTIREWCDMLAKDGKLGKPLRALLEEHADLQREVERLLGLQGDGSTAEDNADREWRRAVASEARVRELEKLVTPPDYGVEHKLLCDWVNSLTEPFRGFVISLETNADPAGNIRDAVCQAENAKALAARARELEAELDLKQAEHDAANAELRRRITNQAESMGLPRIQDVAEIHELKQKLQAAESTLAKVREAITSGPNPGEQWERDDIDRVSLAYRKTWFVLLDHFAEPSKS